MPKASPLKNNFSGGEFSPLAYARIDTERYQTGLEICQNYVPVLQGPVTRRPGNMFVSNTKNTHTAASRLVSFEFSTTQAYILEFGENYVRFFKDQAQITETAQDITAITNANPAVVTYSGSDNYANGDEIYITGIVGAIGSYLNGRNFKVANVNAGANTFELTYLDGSNVNSTSMGSYSSAGTVAEVYTVTTTYAQADIADLHFVQSADTLYILHEDYAPRKLVRTGHTSWTISTITFLDGPYLATNTTTTTLTPGAATGSGVTLTASATTGINGGTGFTTGDVGRHVRLKEGSVWGWAIITGWTSTTVVTIAIEKTLTSTAAKATWRLGTWSTQTGFPACGSFHEDRLVLAGATETPQRLDGSNTNDYENFAPSGLDGTIVDSNAISYSLNSDDVNALKWLISEEKGLLAGTLAGEWVVRPSSQAEALSPTNISAKEATSWGSKGVKALRIDKASLFIQRSGRKIRELTYFYDVDGFRAPDLSALSEHLTAGGVNEIAYQKEPKSVLWCVRADGTLLGMTYERDPDGLKVGWHRHIIGGASDAAGTQAVVESIAVIPSTDGESDELWMIVKRRINGATCRYVEYMTKYFEDTDNQRDAFFVDSGLTYDVPLTITGITAATPPVVTSTSHGLSDGDKVIIWDVVGMTEVNSNSYTVANQTANTFELVDSNGDDVVGAGFTTYVSGGTARKKVSTISGLWHLEGQTVDVLGDGAVQARKTVTNGAVTLQFDAGTVQLGLNIVANGKLLRLDGGDPSGTSLGSTRRTNVVGFFLHRTLGLKIGENFDSLQTITFRTSSDLMGHATELFSGIMTETFDADYNTENQICWRQDSPLPGTILAVLPNMVVNER